MKAPKLEIDKACRWPAWQFAGRVSIVQVDSLAYLEQAIAAGISFPLVLGSPPYPAKCRRYSQTGEEVPVIENWAAWFSRVLVLSGRASSGRAFFVVNGSTKGGRYDCEIERALVLAADAGAIVERPVIWHKNAPPNRADFFGNDWEYVVSVKGTAGGGRPIWNWEAIASAPVYKRGGHFRQRDQSGKRRRGGEYPTNELARPRDVLRVPVGGGRLGSKLAHENEAPYPEALAEPFVKAFSNVGDFVLDPFAGSGTTLAVAYRLGRRAIGLDVRRTQCELSGRRIEETYAAMAAEEQASGRE